MKYIMFISIFTSFCMIMGSCTKDKVIEEPLECGELVTYVGHIQTIVESKCAYAGCHNGSGAGPGDYTNYTGVSLVTGTTVFEGYVIDNPNVAGIGMPDPNDVAQDLLLTDEEIQLIRCWRDNDYKEQ